MPNFFPEGNTPLPTDSEERSLLKAVSLLETLASGSGGGGNSGSTFYEIKSANFTAEIGKNYAVDTSSGVVSVTLPTNPQTGEVVGFADAKGTWATNAITILRNGKNIEGSEINFSNNASGTFFVVLFIDSTTGWRVLTSGTKPLNLTAPTVAGTYEFTSTNGTWTGSPTSFNYQWQMSEDGETGWANIEDADASTYTALEADEGKYVRIGVIATNSNGPSTVVYSATSNAIDIPDFPTSGLVAFYKLNNNGSGGLSLTDSSENAYTLTNNNGVALGTGIIGGAADFDSGEYLTSSAPKAVGAFTLCAWIKAPNTLGSYMQLAGVWTHPPFNCFLGTDDSGNAAAAVGDTVGSAIFRNTTDLVRDDTWHFLVSQCNTSTGLFRVKVDNGSWRTAGDPPPNTLGDGQGFRIGADSGQGVNADGLVDNVGFWNRVLDDGEVAQLYNSGNGVEP